MARTIRIDRLRHAIEDAGFPSALQFAKALGVGQSTISNILTGRTTDSRHLPRIADFLGVSLGWLLGTSEDPHVEPKGYYEDVARDMGARLINEVDLRFSMGAGTFVDEVHHQRVPVPESWFFPAMKGTVDDVFVTYPVGDSMQPTISEGDVVVVDRSQTRLDSQDNIWCITYGDVGMIKRLRQMPDGGVLVISDNPAVENFTAYDQEVHTIGRVIWIGRQV
jgi:SOS-response transcriptional repressor LexA